MNLDLDPLKDFLDWRKSHPEYLMDHASVSAYYKFFPDRKILLTVALLREWRQQANLNVQRSEEKT